MFKPELLNSLKTYDVKTFFSDFFYYVSLCYEIMGQNEKLYTKKKKYV